MEYFNLNKVLKRALFFVFLFGVCSCSDRNEILKPVKEKETFTIKEESAGDNSNKKPVIQKLTADPSSVRMGKKLSLFVTASDPDGDELSYSWESTAGEFSENNVSVAWTAPLGAPCCVPGPYLITVTVQDGKGGIDSGEFIVEVTP